MQMKGAFPYLTLLSVFVCSAAAGQDKGPDQPVARTYSVATKAEDLSSDPAVGRSATLKPEDIPGLLKMAQSGDGNAQLLLALAYNNGTVVKQDFSEAARWFRKAADQGSATAQFFLGNMFQQGIGVPRDYAEARKWLLKAAEQGVALARSNVGTLYLQGLGGPQDKVEGLKWIRKASEAGLAAAQFMFAMFGTADAAERELWLRKAADQNLAAAQFKLVSMYSERPGIRSPEERLQIGAWLRSAALQGYPDALNVYRLIAERQQANSAQAQFILGLADERHQKDYASAMSWYRKAADQGYAQAELGVGHLYEKGLGVSQDSKQAVAWYRRAAEHGDAVAQNNLGNMLLTGNGVEKNIEDAVKWYQKSAEQGQPEGQADLSGMYLAGSGVPKDMVSAYMWCKLAVGNGFRDCEKTVGYLGSKMTAEQIAEAEQKAQAWRAAHPQNKATLP